MQRCRCIRSRPIACFSRGGGSATVFFGRHLKVFFKDYTLRKSNFVINPSHCFACLVGGNLQSIDSTLRLELKELGPWFLRRYFKVSFVEDTLCQSKFGIHPCIDLLALSAANLPAIDTTRRFWISKRSESDHRFFGRFQSFLRGKILCAIQICGPALASTCVLHQQQLAGSKLSADQTSCTLCRI